MPYHLENQTSLPDSVSSADSFAESTGPMGIISHLSPSPAEPFSETLLNVFFFLYSIQVWSSPFTRLLHKPPDDVSFLYSFLPLTPLWPAVSRPTQPRHTLLKPEGTLEQLSSPRSPATCQRCFHSLCQLCLPRSSEFGHCPLAHDCPLCPLPGSLLRGHPL